MSAHTVLSCDTQIPESQPPNADMCSMDGAELHIEMDLQGFTFADRLTLLPELSHSVDTAGGWVLQQETASPDSVDLLLEVQATALPEVYAALLSSVELSRDSHRAMAERCNCSLHLRPTPSTSSILTIHLEVRFLIDPPPLLDLAHLVLLGAAAA
jgi:hypothetical protein